MILDTLKSAGLTDAEIKIYEVLLNSGGQFAGKIINLTGLKRGDCYNKIYDLVDRKLIVETQKNNKKYFELNAPDSIESYIEKQIENLNSTQKEIKSILPSILSTYNLAYHKPGVKFFEGKEAVDKVTRDALQAKTEILSFVDVASVLKNYPDVNEWFRAQRKQIHKVKRVIVADNPINHKYFNENVNEFTEPRFIDYGLENFDINMQIYDDKISYLSVLPKTIISIIIEDKNITRMHRLLFEYTWKSAKKLNG